jgi:Peptidase C65 Otubain
LLEYYRTFYRDLSSTSFQQSDDPYSKCLLDLTSEDTLLVTSSTEADAPIGFPLSLDILKGDFGFNRGLVDKVDMLKPFYSGLRRARGDGNCYYRAVIFGLLEQIVHSQDKHKLQLLAAKLGSLKNVPSWHAAAHAGLLSRLQEVIAHDLWVKTVSIAPCNIDISIYIHVFFQ